MTASDRVRAEDTAYRRELGKRLRAVRNGLGLSLMEVQDKSGGEWAAVVIGAAERGDRGVSTCSLVRLARFYGAPAGFLLTGSTDVAAEVISSAVSQALAADRARISALIDEALWPDRMPSASSERSRRAVLTGGPS
jgi:transcriptional regulator with XRE-family HTH domain